MIIFPSPTGKLAQKKGEAGHSSQMREDTFSRGWVSLLEADAIRKVSLISTFYGRSNTSWSYLILVCVCIALASLSFQVLSDPPASASRVVSTVGMHWHAQPEVCLLTGIVLPVIPAFHYPSWLMQGYSRGHCLAPGRKAA